MSIEDRLWLHVAEQSSRMRTETPDPAVFIERIRRAPDQGDPGQTAYAASIGTILENR